jgi:hypothetical protein
MVLTAANTRLSSSLDSSSRPTDGGFQNQKSVLLFPDFTVSSPSVNFSKREVKELGVYGTFTGASIPAEAFVCETRSLGDENIVSGGTSMG